MPGFLESDMFIPLKNYFEDTGYTVNGEVNNCDLIASKEDVIIIVEIKKTFNMTLLYQAIDRQKLTDLVFVAVPKPAGRKGRTDFSKMKHILKKLDLGLMTISMDCLEKIVEIEILPSVNTVRKNHKKRRKMISELYGRNIDTNVGGGNRKKLVTAYREKCIAIACALEIEKETTPAKLIKGYGLFKNTGAILNNNFYGWFHKKSRGVYGLSQAGVDMLCGKEFEKAVAYYRQKHRHS